METYQWKRTRSEEGDEDILLDQFCSTVKYDASCCAGGIVGNVSGVENLVIARLPFAPLGAESIDLDGIQRLKSIYASHFSF